MVSNWEGTAVNRYIPTLIGFFGFPTFGPNGTMLLYEAAVTDDDLFSHLGRLSLSGSDLTGIKLLVEREGLMIPFQWLDAEHLLVQFAGSGGAGAAMVTIDGLPQPLAFEEGDTFQFVER